MSTTLSPRGPPRLSHKRIDVTFTKANGTFAESGTDTVKLTGLRASAIITKAGGATLGGLQLRLWGMTLSKMNDLSTLGLSMAITSGGLSLFNNTVLIEAGDDDAGMSVVFFGTIYEAWADFAGTPEVAAWESSAPGRRRSPFRRPVTRG